MNNYELENIKLAGVTFGDAQDVIRQLIFDAGISEYQLVREPDNQFDQNAVRVECYTMRIGYIPKILSGKVARLLDEGRQLKAQLKRVNKHPNHPTFGLIIDVVDDQNIFSPAAQ